MTLSSLTTCSNGGVFGSLFGTPIINPPQSAILGMHGVFERPVVRNGQVDLPFLRQSQYFAFQVVIRPMMYIALTYDHRLVDGREAVTFLRTIKNAVEDPRIMLMDLKICSHHQHFHAKNRLKSGLNYHPGFMYPASATTEGLPVLTADIFGSYSEVEI